jgi:hypothetical protein
LEEVAEVRDGIEEQRSLALINGVPAVALDILKQSGANTVEVVDRVKKIINKLQSELPKGTIIDVVRDGSTVIKDSVNDVQETLILGGILTILIVFCFLNSWRSTVITGLTLPISVISSFIVMNFMGMTLNVMTLIVLAIGLLITLHTWSGEHRPPSGKVGSFLAQTHRRSGWPYNTPHGVFVGNLKGIVGAFPVRHHRDLCRSGSCCFLHPGPLSPLV